MKLTGLADRFELPIPERSFEDVCKLTGGEYTRKGDKEICYYERGPRSATEIVLEDHKLKIFDMSVKPFSSERKETLTESAVTVELPSKPKFFCRVINDTVPQGYPFYSSYIVTCLAEITEKENDPFSKTKGRMMIEAFVGATANLKVDYYDTENPENSISIRRTLNPNSEVVERIIENIRKMKGHY